MFKNLKVELNDSDNLFECINNLGKSESIKLIEELLIQNKNVFSIFISKFEKKTISFFYKQSLLHSVRRRHR